MSTSIEDLERLLQQAEEKMNTPEGRDAHIQN